MSGVETRPSKGKEHKSSVISTDLRWTNAYIPRNEERVNSVVIWEHNVLAASLPQIDVGDIKVTSEVKFPELTPAELALNRPFAFIYDGQVTPDTAYLKNNLADLEKRPFDGWLLRVASPRNDAGLVFNELMVDGKRQIVDLGWRAFRSERFTDAEVAAAIEDVKAAKSAKLKHNFIGITTFIPADVNANWFDDAWWSTVLNNCRLLARVAKQGGCSGLMMDPEEYLRGWIWTYTGLKDDPAYKGKSFEQVKAQVRRRGREFAKALNSEYPGIQVMMIHAYETVLNEGALAGKGRLPEVGMALVVPFLDGFLEGSDAKSTVVDGVEGGYSCLTPSDFLAKARRLRRDGPKLSDVPELFRKKLKVGFSIYTNYATLDPDHPEKGINWAKFDSDHPENNFWSPERLTSVVAGALIAADGPVWLWNEQQSWLLDSAETQFPTGVNPKHAGWVGTDLSAKYVPRVYWSAVNEGRKQAEEFIRSRKK